jgi:hypothetical protein
MLKKNCCQELWYNWSSNSSPCWQKPITTLIQSLLSEAISEINFYTLFPSTPKPPNWSVHFRFSKLNRVHAYCLPHTGYVHIAPLNDRNNFVRYIYSKRRNNVLCLPLFDISQSKILIMAIHSQTNINSKLSREIWSKSVMRKRKLLKFTVKIIHYCLGIDVLTAVFVKNSIFWHVTPCSPLNVNWRFERKCLHLQGRRISQAINQCEADSKLGPVLVSCLAYSSILKTEATRSSETSFDPQRTTRRYISC